MDVQQKHKNLNENIVYFTASVLFHRDYQNTEDRN